MKSPSDLSLKIQYTISIKPYLHCLFKGYHPAIFETLRTVITNLVRLSL